MSIKEIRMLTNLSQESFCLKYGIPLSTLKKWEVGVDKPNHRDCPSYVKNLLLRAVKHDFSISD